VKRKLHLFFAMNVSPRQTHSSLRRQVFPGRLKSHAVQTSSVTIDGGCKYEWEEWEVRIIRISKFRM